MKKLSNRLLSGLLLACGGMSAAMAAPVEFKVLADWGTGYNAQIKLTNETAYTMTDWRLAFDFEGDIKNLYSGKLVSARDGHFIVEGHSWNRQLKAGRSIVLGWNGAKAPTEHELANISFAGTQVEIPSGPYFVGYDLQADWGTGYVASINVSNNSEADMNGWTLSFDYPYPITHLYNTAIVSQEGDRYTVEGVDEGSDLSPGEATVFVLRGNVGGLTERIANIEFSYD